MILKCFYLLKGLGCRQPSSQTLLLQSHAFEWSADKKKKSHAFYPLKSGGCSIFQEQFQIWIHMTTK